MQPRVWVNPRQPQTMYIAQLLLYFQGGFDLLFWVIGGLGVGTLFGSRALAAAYVLLVIVGKLAAAFGIANEMRWGLPAGRRRGWRAPRGPRVALRHRSFRRAAVEPDQLDVRHRAARPAAAQP